MEKSNYRKRSFKKLRYRNKLIETYKIEMY